jgi:hypothetical protein
MLPGTSPTPTRLLALILAAFACLAVAAREARAARAEPRPFTWDGYLTLQAMLIGAVAVLFAGAFLGIGSPSLATLHVVARTFSSAGVAWAVLGGFLLAIPRPLARVASLAAFVAAAGALAAGSNAFRDRYAPDPLIAAAPPLVVDPLPRSPVRRVTITGRYRGLRLAPDAQHVVVTGLPNGFRPMGSHVVAGFDGFRRTVDAQDVGFVDADTLFVVRGADRARILSTEGVRDGRTRWSLRLDEPGFGLFEVDPDGRWRLAWPDVGETGARIRLEGRIGEAAAHAPTSPYLALQRRWRGGMNPFAWLAPRASMSTTLASVGVDGAPAAIVATRLMVDCRSGWLSAARRTCLAVDDQDTFVWDVDVARGRVTPVAWTPHVLRAAAADERLLIARDEGDVVALWRGTARAVRLGDGEHGPLAYDGAYAAGLLASLTSDGNETAVTLYAVTPPASSATASR